MADVKISWPLQGLNKNQSFTDQAPNTSRDLLNCRGIDPLTGRLRGAQRSGLLALGLTSAEMCTNLLTTPETFTVSGGDWVISGTITANPAAASPVQNNPYGESTPNPAVEFVCATSGIGEVTQVRGNFTGQQIFSVHAKRPTAGSDQADLFQITLEENGSGFHSARFDVSVGGVVTLNSNDPHGPIAGFTVTSGVTSASNGWYRCWVAVAAASNTDSRTARIELGRTTPTAGERMWFWGAELCDDQLTLTPYRNGAIASAEKVQWIEPIVVDDRKITWAKNSPGTSITTTNGEFGVTYNADGFGGDMAYDNVQGRLYVQIADNRIGEYDKTGNLLDTIEVPNPPASGLAITTRIIQFVVDTVGNIFATVGLLSSATMPSGDPPKDANGDSIARSYRVSRDISGNWGVAWTILHNVSYPTALRVRSGKMYVARYVPHASIDDNGTPAFSVYTNIYSATPSSYPEVFANITAEANTDIRIRGMDVNSNGLAVLTGVDKSLADSGIYTVDTGTGLVFASLETNTAMGLGCKFDGDTAVYVAGHDGDISRCSIGAGGAINQLWTKTPSSSDVLGTTFQARMDIDKFGNVWVPLEDSTTSGANVEGFESTAGASVAVFAGTASSANGAFAVAVDSDIPNYRDTTTTWPEHVWVSSHLAYKVNFATPTVTSGSPRTQTNVVVAGGLVRTFTVDDWTATPPTVSVMTPNDSSSGAMKTVDFVQATTLFNKVFFVDGFGYRVYDPKNIANSSFGELTDFEATKGVIPPRCKLISAWRGRIVLARGDNEQEWFLSAQSDPMNWLFFPPVSSATQAVQGSLARAGLVPDVTNGIIPYTDDLLLMGGDHSIWRFTGDPAAGGQIDLVSDITGMAFGKAWCKDPDGIIYFFGSRGGVFRMSPESMPQRITYGSIERDLQDLDLSANYIRLVWNYRDEGLHVFQIPYGAVTAQLDHWFWEQKSGGWYKDNFYDTSAVSNQPTAAAVVDGDDPNDRRLLLGGGGNTSLSSGDGYVAAWDANTYTDTGTAIYSKALIGPFQSDDKEVRMVSFSPVLASDQSGANYRLYVTPTADTLGGQVFNGTMQSGRNPRLRLRGRGSHIFLEISDASINRWAFETATVEVYPAGRQRVRAV